VKKAGVPAAGQDPRSRVPDGAVLAMFQISNVASKEDQLLREAMQTFEAGEDSKAFPLDVGTRASSSWRSLHRVGGRRAWLWLGDRLWNR